MNDVVFMLGKKSTQKLDMGTSRFTEVVSMRLLGLSMRLLGLSLRFIGLSEESIHGVHKWFFKNSFI